MQHTLWKGIVLTAVLVFVTVLSPPAEATEKIGEVEQVACTACHDKPGSKLYTDKGKYYELMRTFDGYDEILASFRQCTSCHVRKPGSEKLTRQGRRFSKVVFGMEDLKNLMMSSHPSTPAVEKTAEPEESAGMSKKDEETSQTEER